MPHRWATWNISGRVGVVAPVRHVDRNDEARDGKRVYLTNSLYSTWDNQFYPDGVPGAEVMAIASPTGGLKIGEPLLGKLPRGIPRASDPTRRR
jgi:56kDa selenium binding protein (SBP56)